MKISTSNEVTEVAIANVLAKLGDVKPSFLVLHMAATHNADVARSLLTSKFDNSIPIHGGTSCLGVMTGDGASIEDSCGLGIATFEDIDGDFGTGIADLGDDPFAAAARATRAALTQAARDGEAPELIWLTAAPGAEEAVLSGVESVVCKDCRIVGGSAADNSISGDWFVFDGVEKHGNGVIVSVMFPSGSCSSAYQSGYAPTKTSGVATKTEGRRVFEIDGAPAKQVYANWTGGAVCPSSPAEPEAILAASTFSPLGRPSAEVADVPFFLLAHPATVYPDDSVEFFADIEEGEELHLMTGGIESLTSRAGRVAAQAVEQTEESVAGALVIYCGGCMLAVQDHMDGVASGIDKALNGAPFLGVFTFGEQGPVLNCDNRNGNLMISCITFGS